MSSSAETVREEIASKKAAYEAEMAELARKEKEAAEKEEEEAHNAEAALIQLHTARRL